MLCLVALTVSPTTWCHHDQHCRRQRSQYLNATRSTGANPSPTHTHALPLSTLAASRAAGVLRCAYSCGTTAASCCLSCWSATAPCAVNVSHCAFSGCMGACTCQQPPASYTMAPSTASCVVHSVHMVGEAPSSTHMHLSQHAQLSDHHLCPQRLRPSQCTRQRCRAPPLQQVQGARGKPHVCHGAHGGWGGHGAARHCPWEACRADAWGVVGSQMCY